MCRALLSVFFVVYFAVWLSGGIGLHWPERVFPEWLLFFTRSAGLFPNAAVAATDYHAEGWDCGQGRWVEIDPAPYFPLIISGRETRFDRIVHLYRYNQRVMEALRIFLMTHWNADHPLQPITDVRLLSVRTPVPPPGSPIQRYQRRALADVPPRQHKLWSLFTPLPVREQRCQAVAAGQSFDPRDPPGEGRPGRRQRPAPTESQAPKEGTDRGDSGGES